jgi:hypothetical protein
MTATYTTISFQQLWIYFRLKYDLLKNAAKKKKVSHFFYSKNTKPISHGGCTVHTFEVLDRVRHDVVEDVEATLVGSLKGDSGFLQKINFHVSPGQLAALVEVDPDEFAL